MLQDVNVPHEQHLIHFQDDEEFSSPIINQLLDFGDDGELFAETIRTSEVSSCSGGGYVGGEECNDDMSCFDVAQLSSPFSSLSSMDPSTLVELLDAADQGPPISMYYPPALPSVSSFKADDQFNLVSLASNSANGYALGYLPELPAISQLPQIPPSLPLLLPPPHLALDEECSVRSLGLDYKGLDEAAAACAFVDPTGASMDTFFPGSMGTLLGTEGAMPMPEPVEYRPDCDGLSFFPPENIGQHMAYDSSDIQVQEDGQQAAGTCSSPLHVATEMPLSEEATFKVGKLSAEERKEKINRYRKKRNQRNFSKKIKYACRKTLADSRPRVRGRFAKNDEFGETTRHASSDDEDGVVKDKDLIDPSDIFAQLSSFKCNYTLESWM